MEETHYYPFGLTMAGISTSAPGKLENKFKFNGIELNTDFDLNIQETFYRSLDPQIGRFLQVDPKPVDHISPYAAMRNNPITNTDFMGDTTIYYNMGTGAVLGTINNSGAVSRVKVNALAYLAGMMYAAKNSLDLGDQGTANGFVSDFNSTLSRLDASSGLNTISFETGELRLSFTGESESSAGLVGQGAVNKGSAKPEYANGTLNVHSVFDDGSTLFIQQYNAKSGPWDYSALPNGYYSTSGIVNTSEKGMVRNGVGFKVFLNDNTQYNRTQLRIHPDQVPSEGTAGCIGLAATREQLNQFRSTVQGYFNNHNTMRVRINVNNNPNYARPASGRAVSGE